MELKTLEAKPRIERGTGVARRLRTAGSVPSVVYGLGSEPASLTVDGKLLAKLIHDAGEHAVLQIEVPGQPDLSGPALVKQVQHHPVRGFIMHVDFLRVDLKKKIQTIVAINLVGRAKGVVEGGVLDHQLREVEVECLPTDVPDTLTLDVTNIGIGDNLHVSDIKPPAGVEIITEGDRAVLAILQPRVVKSAADEAAEAEAAAAVAESEGAKEGEGE